MKTLRAFIVHKNAALLFLAVCILCPLASAQKGLPIPEVDIFGGYSYLRFGGASLGFPGAVNMYGGENVEVAVHVYQGLSAVADFSGHYSKDLQEYNFLLGAQYKFDVRGLHFYGQALGGKARTRLGNVGSSQIEPSSLGGAVAVGGGLELPWKGRIVWRPVQADYLVNGAFSDKFNSIRISTGIVFRLGKLPTKTPGL